ncbi:LysM peptidoglycan-binding domain-containing protein [Roseibacterium sp. SDUM158017]|uniref:LysM peptidoglycan-binding domain-containing protein n=1 Tax=Roseicyclus salinarum TaxID=3036773 RepID=UPI002415006F|nr:LysM peptidoglycan-binding domain-containing protein [Roseibacterium sp. SDUM158017]MDG4648774.1 LysM peptidoglycan-binding domain-containing protein [Roseibacterium sp. SDUM158017]
MRLGAAFGEGRAAVSLAALAGVAVVVAALAFVTLRDDAGGPVREAATPPAGAVPPGGEASGSATPLATPAGGEAARDDVAPQAARDDVAPDGARDDVAPEAVEQAEGQGDDATGAPAPATPVPPRFDQIRVAPDGAAVVAGRAPSGADVSLLSDGEEVSVAQAARDGGFAAIFELPPSDRPRILSLVALMPDGVRIEGVETVIIAPFGTDARADAAPPDEAPAPQETADAPTGPEGEAVSDEVALAAPEARPLPRDEAVDATEGQQVGTAADGDGPMPRPSAPEAVAALDAPSAPEPAAPSVTPPGQAPAIVIAGPEGLRVVQAAGSSPAGGAPADAPLAQTEVRLDAIAYNLEGDVVLSGRGPADAQLQVLLNNQPIEMGEIGSGGTWSLDLPDVDPGTYTLTVAEVSPQGEVLSEVETPFLREDPERIAASPMMVGAGISVITVQPGFTLWGIAEANFGEGIAYVQIFQENREEIRNPDLIFPGQIFRLPDLPRGTDAQ